MDNLLAYDPFGGEDVLTMRKEKNAGSKRVSELP
jgi:hypothetical protein